MTSRLIAAALLATTALTAPVYADTVTYKLDPSHSQIMFNYEHLGYSTTYGLFGGIEGDIAFDSEDPAASSVEVSFPAASMLTGWEPRETHFMTGDFFGAEENATVTFTSTDIEVTGEDTANITGDLTINGITKPVVLDAVMTQKGEHPMEGKEWAGFKATTVLTRSDFDMGMFAPYVSDEVNVNISIEAMKADG
ncbi:YceI family protein [Chachezhania antarctica]|uniref:YceI family protein n=1 Tax=Chachezhania antarctica TaxID=2340860 RepID=UPI000EAC5EFA|nr:YceI family protein [Chachezhania antarctica]|tara:strand:+ start:394 stop:978 length:585 start_codon:yes stop_codon:yes gene_type:complete